MKLKKLFELAIETGIENDVRGKKEINRILKERRKAFEKLKTIEKKEIDEESLWNPFSDSRILNYNKNNEVKTIMVGIDIETPELLLAEKLMKEKKIDLIIAHHPEGRPLARLYEVMGLQTDLWQKFGIPINIGEALMSPRAAKVGRALHGFNATRTIDAAKLLNISLMCLHTAADNMVAKYLQTLFDKKKPFKVKNVIELLKEIPEYKKAVKDGLGPSIFVGSEENRAGKVLVDMTGGTEGPKEIIEKMSIAGIGTIVGMHMGENLRKEAEKNHINVVIAGHMSSDSLGLNLLLDEIERKTKEKLNVIECSGFIRVKRKK